MAYLDTNGLTRLWNKIKAQFGGDVTASTTATTASVTLKNKAATPDTLGTATIGAATTTDAGVMTADDKTKLNGIESGATANEGTVTQVTASGALSASPATSGSASYGISHSTEPGYKHVPSGGSSGQILSWDSNGTAKWSDAPYTGVTKLVAGSNVTISPAGGTGEVTVNATDTTYSDATTSASGLMSASDKTKINGIAEGAEVNVQPDWEEDDTTDDSYIKNKPTIPSKVSDLTNDSGYQTSSDVDTKISTAMTGAAMYKGALASEAEFTALTNYKAGWYYIVSTSWTSTVLGITLDAGNMLFVKTDYNTSFKASDWDVIQSDIEAIPNSVIDALS